MSDGTRKGMDPDFQAFQMKLLFSLRQTTPLDENLRAVMGSSLWKLKQYCDATVAMHVFVNLEIGELHVLTLGLSESTQRALNDEIKRHYEGNNPNFVPRSNLPAYLRVPLQEGSDIPDLLRPLNDVRAIQIPPSVIDLFNELSKEEFDGVSVAEEFDGVSVAEGDWIIVIPLGVDRYGRLGGIILWDKSDKLAEIFREPDEKERLIVFRSGIEQLLIGLFTNFYQMTPHTYLPSYYCVEQKPVALLCAEIQDFDRVSEILRHRFGPEKALDCLSKLVNRFSEKAAEVIEREPYRGRVDQIWGNGLLAVFGEYMDIHKPSPELACKRAVAVAADLIEESVRVFERWLCHDFQYEDFLKYHNEHISLRPVVAVDYGYVVFDYVGSSKNRVYMSVGDHVNFVKQLATASTRSDLSDNAYHPIMRHLIMRQLSMEGAAASAVIAQLDDPPIILSQAAYTGSRHILVPLPYMPEISPQQARKIMHLPGKTTIYSVYEIWPGNVDRTKVS